MLLALSSAPSCTKFGTKHQYWGKQHPKIRPHGEAHQTALCMHIIDITGKSVTQNGLHPVCSNDWSDKVWKVPFGNSSLQKGPWTTTDQHGNSKFNSTLSSHAVNGMGCKAVQLHSCKPNYKNSHSTLEKCLQCEALCNIWFSHLSVFVSILECRWR